MGRGRPKAAKKIDIVPTLTEEDEERALEARKHVTFDEDADIEDYAPITVTIDSRKAEDKESEEADAAPEEIAADSMQIQQLKEQYEQSLQGSKKGKKKRRVAAVVEEEELDEEVLAALQQTAEPEDKEEDEEEEEEEKKKGMRIEVNPREKIIGRLKVIALEDTALHPLVHFTVSPAATAFERQQRQGGERVSLSSLQAQRRRGPAKRFRVTAPAVTVTAV